jgi:hypothetical protein
VDLAHEEGINFDTADRYGGEPGETETIIGNWFVSRAGRRERAVIATKVYGEMGIGPNEGKLEETWQAIEVPVQAGKILYAGSSHFAGWQIVWSRPGLRNLGDIAGYRRRRAQCGILQRCFNTMAESLGMTHEDGRPEHDQSASHPGSRFGHLRIFALGAPITVLVTVGPLEIFQLRMAVPAVRLGPFEA